MHLEHHFLSFISARFGVSLLVVYFSDLFRCFEQVGVGLGNSIAPIVLAIEAKDK